VVPQLHQVGEGPRPQIQVSQEGVAYHECLDANAVTVVILLDKAMVDQRGQQPVGSALGQACSLTQCRQRGTFRELPQRLQQTERAAEGLDLGPHSGSRRIVPHCGNLSVMQNRLLILREDWLLLAGVRLELWRRKSMSRPQPHRPSIRKRAECASSPAR